MPTLGFLKKLKPNKDDKDPASPDAASSNSPKSPATPTKTGFFHRSRLSSSANHQKQQHQASPSSNPVPTVAEPASTTEETQQQKQSQLLPQSGHLNAGLPPSAQSLSPGTAPPPASALVPPEASDPSSAAAIDATNSNNIVNQQQDPSAAASEATAATTATTTTGDATTASSSGAQAATASTSTSGQDPKAVIQDHPDKSITNDQSQNQQPTDAPVLPHENSSAPVPAQNDTAAAGPDTTQQPQSSNLAQASSQQTTTGAAASPGTDTDKMLSQQHIPTAAAAGNGMLPQQQQQQQHPVQQQQYQQQQVPVQRQANGHQPQPSHQGASLPRATKGKYSLKDFDILRTLGTGSFGRVHLVQSKHNSRFYAVKVLKKAQVVKMKQVEHTNDERRMLADVKHPFLITLWGTFADTKNLYMVMDFVEGGELFSLLRKSGRFPNPVAKFYAAEVTLALEYMHSKNIIYRDLKPENLLLDRHGHLKITDFGFAKRVPDKTWTLCGTPDYLAPEVVSNKGYNKSVDWWSLGILIYEMLCGYTPFWDAGSPMKIYENILKGKIKYPTYLHPDAQNLLEKLITPDLTKRLGNLYAGSQDVKSHPWFQEVTWDRLARKDIDAPYTPPVKAGEGDASQFDRYPEEVEKYGVTTGHDEFGHMFTEF